MELQFPSPQEIYDLNTDQLNKIQISLQSYIKNQQKNVKNQENHEQKIEKYTNLLESIQLEIQQRKTLQFFNEIYQLQNPYVKKITDFNTQFAKLAAQAIQKQQQTSRLFEKQQKEKNNFNQNREQTLNSINSSNFQKKNQTTKYSSQSEKNTKSENNMSQHEGSDIHSQASLKQRQQTDLQNKSVTSIASLNQTKKMGIGFKKNNKKKMMQEFMKAALSKAKVSQYVVTKGGIATTLQKSPQKRTMTNLPMAQTGRPVVASNRSIGSKTSIIDNQQKKVTNSSASTSKKTHHPKNQKEMIKKKQQAVQKLKNMKNTTKQVTKIDRNFVQMVKKQEQKKRKRLQKQAMQRQKSQIEKQQKKQSENSPPNSQIQQKIEQQIITTSQKDQRNSSKQPIKKIKSQSQNSQNEPYQIKEEINIISSDTQQDTKKKSLQKSCSKIHQNKINLTKQKQKERKYSLKAEDVIKEQEMQQSLVIGKIKQKKFQISQETSTNKPISSATAIASNSVNITNNSNQVININPTSLTSTSTIGKQNEKPSLFSLQGGQKQKSNQTNTNANKNSPSSHAIQNQKFGQITQQLYSANQEAYDFQKQALNYIKETPYYGDDDNQDEQNNQDSHQHQNQNDDVQRPATEHMKQSKQILSTNKKVSTKSLKEGIQQQKLSSNKKTTNKAKNNKKQQILPSNQIQKSQQNKKCYNEEYWLHIKEEAQLKIQRFKQEKQLIQRQKQRERERELQQNQLKLKKVQEDQLNKDQQDGDFQKENENEKNDKDKDKHTSSLKAQCLQQDQNDKFIKNKNEQFKKISKTMTKKTTKKNGSILNINIKQPKINYQKPQFNYLEIFPTFNHLFNVMYLKPNSQALLDIPVIMKQLSLMFEAHIQHFKQKNSHFKPAIFLPFDHSNNLQLTDAKQLLMHAQTTYVNLKTLVQRLQIFNGNLQGQFSTNDNRYYRVVKTKEEVYDIITTGFLRRKGWKELPHGCNLRASWNLFWSWSKPQVDMNKLLVVQKINHFPFNKNLSRKDLLYKNIEYFRKTHKVSFPFLPLTFNLPKQFTQFSKKFHEQQLLNRNQNYWIMKPIGKSRGRGIKVINSLSDINYVDNIVVQKYINNPMLLEGYKFDLRIYVLVTSFHPLEAFVYKEGFARLSTQKFTLEPNAMKNNFVHLTNFSINRHNQQAAGKFAGGSKISLKSLKDKLTKMGHSWNSIWSQVHQIIVKSLLACSVSVPPFPGAFQLFGYDIMIDSQQQCQLIEINSSPSLQRSYLIDQIVKQSLIDDIIEIVDPPDFDKQELLNIINERLDESKKKYSSQEDLIALARVLKYKKIRKFGEVPQKIGLFEMIAPSKMSTELQKLIKGKSGINNPHNID